MAFEQSQSYTSSYRQATKQKGKYDQIAEASFIRDYNYRQKAAKDAGKNWEAIQSLLKTGSTAYMDIQKERFEKKRQDAIEIARNERLSEKNLEILEGQYRQLRTDKDEGEDVKTQLEATLKEMNVELAEQRRILAEIDKASHGIDHDIMQKARAKVFFSPLGPADEGFRDYLAVKQAEWNEANPTKPWSETNTQIAVRNYTNQAVLREWGDDPDGENWRKANIYPDANEWEKKRLEQSVLAGNVEHGVGIREVQKKSLTLDEVNVQDYLTTVSSSTGTDGKTQFGMANAHQQLVEDYKELIDSGLITRKQILNLHDQKLYGPGFPKEGLLFGKHPTYNKLLEIWDDNLLSDAKRADQVSSLNASNYVDETIDEANKVLEEKGGIPSQEFVNEKIEYLDENFDLKPEQRERFVNKLQSLTFDAEAVNTEFNTYETKLLEGELTEEDLKDISIHNQEHFTKQLELVGDKKLHGKTLKGLDNLVAIQTKALADAAGRMILPGAAEVQLELRSIYMEKFLDKRENGIPLKQARAEASQETEDHYLKNGGESGETDKTKRYYWGQGKDTDTGWQTAGYHNFKRAQALESGKIETEREANITRVKNLIGETKGKGALTTVLNQPNVLWSTENIAKMVKDYNRGEGQLGGYMGEELLLTAKELGVNPYKLLLASANSILKRGNKDELALYELELESKKYKVNPVYDLAEIANELEQLPTWKYQTLFGNKQITFNQLNRALVGTSFYSSIDDEELFPLIDSPLAQKWKTKVQSNGEAS